MGLYDSITKGLTEAIEYEKGNVSAKKVKVTVTPADDFSPKVVLYRLPCPKRQVVILIKFNKCACTSAG